MRATCAAIVLVGVMCTALVYALPSATLAQRTLERLTIWRNPHTGEPVYARACRRAPEGCRERIRQLTMWIEIEARRHDLDPVLVASVVWHETRFNPHVRGPVGEFGIMQLHPRSPWGRAARGFCRRYPDSCERHRVRIAVEVLANSIRRCGSVSEGLGMYNSGRCQVNRYARRVLAVYRRY